MLVIAGLGNPGRRFQNTRHNMGFLVIDKLAEKNGIKVNKLKHKALVGDGVISDQKVLLVKPQTYMNLSGDSLIEVIQYYNIAMENLIVVYDDFDLETGTLRIRKKGSAGSHNGMKSVVERLQSENFPRVRIGIGSSEGIEWKDFVMGKVGKQEQTSIDHAIEQAAEAIMYLLKEGIDRAMNEYNGKSKSSGKDDRGAQGND